MPRQKNKPVVPHANEIIVLIAPPGAGKTTFANDFVKSNENHVKISRDDIRKMTKDSYMVGEEAEHLVSAMQDAAIKAALSKGKSVVLDNTHCKSKYIKELADKYGKDARIILKVIGADLSVKEIKQRNSNREKVVPEVVIDQMYKGYKNVIKTKSELESYIQSVSIPRISNQVVQDESLTKAIIVDIDGTVAHMNDKRGPFDWLKVDSDDPDYNVLAIVRALSKQYKVIFLSGRDSAARLKTEAWLDVYYGLPYEKLLMRRSNDFRKDSIIKREIYDTYIKGFYYIEAVFDDRDQVVFMWREELGLKCMQVEYGNF